MTEKIYQSPAGPLAIMSHRGELVMCDWLNGAKRQSNLKRVHNALDNERAECTVADAALLCNVEAQLDTYFRGIKQPFDVPIRLIGSTFQQQVWQALCEIPFGSQVSYGQLAASIGRQSAVRAVANAVAANAISIIVPCHRVIGCNGTLTGYDGGLDAKRLLLDLECPKLRF